VSKAPGELAVTPAQQALLDSITAQVPRFLRDGGQVTLALSTPVGSRDERLDVERLYSDPRLAFDLLNPVLRALPPAREAMLPVALLVAAIEAPESLSDADRVLVGRALLSGHGAPLNIALARDLLVPVALAGDGGVAADLAGAFAEMDPAEAYGFALRAAGQGMPGALATLDRIEAVLDLATILSAQRDVAGEDLPDAPYASVSAMRATALARALGTAVSRDYGQAWYWASLAAAAGDRTAAALRDEIAARMASHDTQGPAVWAAATAELTARMTEEWLARDLPAQFRQE
jgi:hypothetical protein